MKSADNILNQNTNLATTAISVNNQSLDFFPDNLDVLWGRAGIRNTLLPNNIEDIEITKEASNSALIQLPQLPYTPN